MMDCCVNYLGSFPHNEDLDTFISATQSGVHKVQLFFAGVRITREIDLLPYEPIVIPRPFNEDYTYRMQIIQPDGTLISVDDCEDFSFKIYLNINSDCNGNECD